MVYIISKLPRKGFHPNHSILLVSRLVKSEYLDAALKQGIFNFQFADDAISIDELKISLGTKNILHKCHVHVRHLKTFGDIEPPIFKLVRSFLHGLKAIKEVHIFWICF